MVTDTFTWFKLRNPRATFDPLHSAKWSFIELCCGHNSDQSILEDGLRIFGDLVEKRMLDYEKVSADLLDTLWDAQQKPPYLERQFQTCGLIVRILKSSEGGQTTIDDIVKQLYGYFGVSTTIGNPYEDAMRHLVFAVIGWSTMLYTATFDTADKGFTTIIEGRSTTGLEKQSFGNIIEWSQRPIGALLRGYGVMPIACPPGFTSPQGVPTLLTVPYLNMYSLFKVSDVSVSWVNDLLKHCEFNRYDKKKQLKLFRLPSICLRIYC